MNPVLRFIIWGVFIAVACSLFYASTDGIRKGEILEAHYTRFVSSHAFTVYRAKDPDRFWVEVCWEYYFGLWLLYLPGAEIVSTIKRSKNVKKSSEPSA